MMNHIKTSTELLNLTAQKPKNSTAMSDDDSEKPPAKRRTNFDLRRFSGPRQAAPAPEPDRSAHRRVASADDFTGTSSDDEPVQLDPTTLPPTPVNAQPAGRVVRAAAATNGIGLAHDEAVATALARSDEAIRLSESVSLRVSPCERLALAQADNSRTAVPAATGLCVYRGVDRIAEFAAQHPAGSRVLLPAATIPEPLPEARCDVRAYRHFSPSGVRLANSAAEVARLTAYLVSHPAPNDADLAAIEEAYIRSHAPWSSTAMDNYMAAAATRKHCAMMGDNFTTPTFEYYALLARYGVPPLQRMSLIRGVSIVVPDDATIAIQRSLIGVLMELPMGYCRALVGTYLSFLADSRWLCPFGFCADSFEYWAHAIFIEAAVPLRHTYLDIARVPDASTVAMHLYSLVSKSARLEKILSQLTRVFFSFLAEMNDAPPRLALSTPVDRAVAKYLEWA